MTPSAHPDNHPGIPPIDDVASLLAAAGIDFEILYDGPSGGCPVQAPAGTRAA